ncbi:hypothetical protein MRX96_022253 [Rhipicephalus microplus]
METHWKLRECRTCPTLKRSSERRHRKYKFTWEPSRLLLEKGRGNRTYGDGMYRCSLSKLSKLAVAAETAPTSSSISADSRTVNESPPSPVRAQEESFIQGTPF